MMNVQDLDSILLASFNYGTAEQVMEDINNLSLDKDDPRLKSVKECIDQAVDCVLGPQRASATLQGSTKKGTGIVPSSDWDFFVQLHKEEDTVTKKERMSICGCLLRRLSERGIDYCMQPGQNRVRLWAGDDESGPLPDVDLVFERFKHDARRAPPDNPALERSHVVQQVVKYIKMLPYSKTNLPRPKSSLVEQLVMSIHDILCSIQDPASLVGTAGFDLLLKETLSVITTSTDSGYVSRIQHGIISLALWNNPQLKLNTVEWDQAAATLLKQYMRGRGWLRPDVRVK